MVRRILWSLGSVMALALAFVLGAWVAPTQGRNEVQRVRWVEVPVETRVEVPRSELEYQCIQDNVGIVDPRLATQGVVVQLGARVICGHDLRVSNVLGPTLAAHLNDEGNVIQLESVNAPTPEQDPKGKDKKPGQ